MSIIFYDDDCPLCNGLVCYILEKDTTGQFFFAPLKGTTAEQKLQKWKETYPHVDSLVLFEEDSKGEGRIYFYSQAVFRILWKLGSLYACIGIVSFLPRFMLFPCDVVYRWVAKRRKTFLFNQEQCSLEMGRFKDRFLP